MPLLLVTLWVIASSATFLGCGYVIMRLLRYDPQEPGARLVIGGSLGIALVVLWTAYIGLFLGWHPWLWIVILGAPVIAVFGAKAVWRDLKSVGCSIREWWREANYLERALFVFGVGMFGIFLVQSTLPSTLTDDTRTYLYGPLLQLADGRLGVPAEDGFAGFGFNRQILSVIGFYLWDFRLARAVNIPIMALLINAVVLVTKRVYGLGAAALVLPIVVALQVVYIMGASGKVDQLLSLYVIVIVLAIDYLSTTKKINGAAIVLGVLFGAALGTKPTVLLCVPLVVIWWVRAVRATNFDRISVTHASIVFILFVLTTLLALSVWPLRALLNDRDVLSFIGSGGSLFPALIQKFPLNVYTSILAPWTLTFHKVDASTQVTPFFGLVVLLGIWYRRRLLDTWYLLAAGFGTIFVIALLSTSMNKYFFSVRFMLPGFLMLASIGAAGLSWVIRNRYLWLRWTAGLLLSIAFVVPTVRANQIGVTSTKIALGAETLDTYIDRYVGPAEAIRWSRDKWTWQDTVWTVNVIDMVYFTARMHYSAIGTSRIGHGIFRANDPAARCALMDSARVKWALIGPPLTETGELGRSLAESCMDTAFVSSDGKYVVYRRRENVSHAP